MISRSVHSGGPGTASAGNLEADLPGTVRKLCGAPHLSDSEIGKTVSWHPY